MRHTERQVLKITTCGHPANRICTERFRSAPANCVRPTWACSNGVKVPCGRITLCYKYSKGITSSLWQLQHREVLWGGSQYDHHDYNCIESYRSRGVSQLQKPTNRKHKWQNSYSANALEYLMLQNGVINCIEGHNLGRACTAEAKLRRMPKAARRVAQSAIN